MPTFLEYIFSACVKKIERMSDDAEIECVYNGNDRFGPADSSKLFQATGCHISVSVLYVSLALLRRNQ